MSRHKHLLLAAMIIITASCKPDVPLSQLKRENIGSITLGDCQSRWYAITDTAMVDHFWEAVSTSQKAHIESLRRNTGFARVWVHCSNVPEPVYFEIFAMIEHGPVILQGRDRLVCVGCTDFFNELKRTYPGFNWCQAPRNQ